MRGVRGWLMLGVDHENTCKVHIQIEIATMSD